MAIVAGALDGDYRGPLLNAALMRATWERYVETAHRFNEPGRFTALIGYEWTPTNSGDKLHRNVLYRDGADKAGQVFPFTANDSLNPQDLWAWMQRYENQTGGRVLALAHNGNLSNGQMFPVETNPHTGAAIDVDYVATRARWEPLYEVTQIKGDGEAHPYLSAAGRFLRPMPACNPWRMPVTPRACPWAAPCTRRRQGARRPSWWPRSRIRRAATWIAFRS